MNQSTNPELITRTGDHAARQAAAMLCLTGRRDAMPISTDALLMGGGPLDAPNCIPSGSHTSTEWKRGDGKQLASPVYLRRIGAEVPASMVEVPHAEFQQVLRREERLRNAGSLAKHDPAINITRWTVADHLIGCSLGRVGESKVYWVEHRLRVLTRAVQ